ncbi:MAG: hypothetical protein ABSG88_19190 [Bradyrhizobium sp.]
MNNLELISVLEIAVFGLAIAQMLTIILTIRRERDVKDLRELVEEQRLRLVELRAWLAGRSASQSSRIAPEGKPAPEWTANVKVSESGMPLQETKQPPPPGDDAARAAKALEWRQEVAARLQSGIKAQQVTAPAEDGFRWFKDDPNEPHEIVEARRVVNGKTYQPQDNVSPESLATQPRTSHIEVERTLRAIRFLKEDADKSSAMPSLGRKLPDTS